MAVPRSVVTVAVVAAGILAGVGGALVLQASPGTAPSPSASSDPSEGASPSVAADALPPELRGLAWVAFDGSGYRSGLSGSSATFILPATEVGLAASGHLVLAADTAETSTLVVYDITTGENLMRLPTDFLVDSGAMLGDQFFVTARSRDGIDGGVWTASVGSPALEPLIPASTGTPIDPTVSSRGPLQVSPSGTTLGSTVCSVDGCVTQVTRVDVPKLTVIEDQYLAWLSDEFAIVIGGREIRAYSSSDGRQIWKLTTEGGFFHGYFFDDERTFVESSTEGDGDMYRYEIALIDAATGDRTVVVSVSDPVLREWRLQPALSTDRLAVLLSVWTLEEALGVGGADMRVLDLQAGRVLPLVVPFSVEQP
jgi:hypothetical protein